VNEAKVTTELTNLFKRLWLWPHKIPDTAANHPQGGEPDICFFDIDAVVEVKMFDFPTDPNRWASANFPFSHLHADQRAYLEMFQADGHDAWIALGTRHGTADTEARPRLLWLIPYREWVDLEASVLEYRKSLPLDWRPRLERGVEDNHLVAVFQLASYELYWKDGCWHLPESHPFRELTWTFNHSQGERDLHEMRSTWNALKQR